MNNYFGKKMKILERNTYLRN